MIKEDEDDYEGKKSPYRGRGISIDDAMAARATRHDEAIATKAVNRPAWEEGGADAGGDAQTSGGEREGAGSSTPTPASRRASRRKSSKKAGGLRASFINAFSTRGSLDGGSIDEFGRR